MPTGLDNALKSKNMVLVFGGMVAAAAAWTIWAQGKLFPPEPDPKGSDPETWTRHEMSRWLAARGLMPHRGDSRDELLDRVVANMRIPRP
ncbi:hypothetical protein L249_7626 [Ophiocordyceps polyrhachis-furcata BCC 54312]|uniref:STE24 endopeptidase n=1 Tax=Ophiocordyceps polyrhachis-furcata BCC 54312 TaxID=1330021 RepID=A0A367LA84_9HYPO|nr:hypothetical protein L249_7626 [Ophiocordyceps polyrhachis-furcata BCC 54312]